MDFNIYDILPNQGRFLSDKEGTVKIERTSFVVYHKIENWFEAYNKFTGCQVPVVFSPSIRKRGSLGLKRRNWLLKNLKLANKVRLYCTTEGTDFANNHPNLIQAIKHEYAKIFGHEMGR